MDRNGVAEAARKRKRGALQDISNNTRKKQHNRPSPRRSVSVVKNETDDGDIKPLAPRASARRKATTTTVNTALKSSMASTTASKAKKRAPVSKKTEPTRAKKRKLEGVENQPPALHQKIQTSMLSFQAPVKLYDKQEKRSADKENINEAESAVVVYQKVVESTVTGEAIQIKSEESREDAPEIQTPERSVEQEAVAAAALRDEYVPYPYRSIFDHRDSCFDKETYTESVRDVDAPSKIVSSHHAKLLRELDAFYRKHEIKYLSEADYIGTVQLDINEKMRTILVDWLVEVGEEYELDSQTFHKAVNLVDRCLKKIKINRKQFQLLGCACMMIAAKFEEVYGPNVEEFVYISDQTYTATEMLNMEAQVLKALQYRVASTTCYGFMHRYTKAGCSTEKQQSLVLYLCDFAQLFYHMVRYKPSMLVASAVYLARITTAEPEPWTPTLHHVSKYNPLDFQDCVEELHRLYVIENEVVSTQRDKAKAISEKYLADKFFKASTIPACSKKQLADSLEQYTPSSISRL
ncbi:hypothetical protein CCR75_007043 [Bremia lactucae]|uniref:Cyclin n=1 Tax=Bremia lactucae TaxID=4779 RepID=A0A976FP68_BRELC|nr:hypothetical protein CCR75_007043 [Bremia lactucae]